MSAAPGIQNLLGGVGVYFVVQQDRCPCVDVCRMISVGPFLSTDPFADATNDPEVGGAREGFIHIRIQQRNGRKTLTTVQGISDEFDKKRIVKAFKKVHDSIYQKSGPCFTTPWHQALVFFFFGKISGQITT